MAATSLTGASVDRDGGDAAQLLGPPFLSATAMKSFASLLAFAGLAVVAAGVARDVQEPMLATEHPGFSLDLLEQRLVQVEGQDPVWVSELEKARLALRMTQSDVANVWTDQHEGGRRELLRHVSTSPLPPATEFLTRLLARMLRIWAPPRT